MGTAEAATEPPAGSGDAPVFVVGCPRSGTGMLRDLLRNRIAIPPESHFIPALAAVGDPADESEARALGARILGLATVRRWGVNLTPADFSGCRSYPEAVATLFEGFAESQGKRRWGDKTPEHITRLPLLADLFPSARFLHILRDGRDVAHSWLDQVHGPHNVYAAARAWRRRVRAGRADGARATGTEAIEVSKANRWRRTLPPGHRAIFESAAGDLLAELGYEVEGLAGPLPAWRRAGWTLDDRVRSLAAKRRFTQLTLRDVARLGTVRARAWMRDPGRFSGR